MMPYADEHLHYMPHWSPSARARVGRVQRHVRRLTSTIGDNLGYLFMYYPPHIPFDRMFGSSDVERVPPRRAECAALKLLRWAGTRCSSDQPTYAYWTYTCRITEHNGDVLHRIQGLFSSAHATAIALQDLLAQSCADRHPPHKHKI